MALFDVAGPIDKRRYPSAALVKGVLAFAVRSVIARDL